MIPGVVVAHAQRAVRRLPVSAGAAAGTVIAGVTLRDAVVQVTILEQRSADPGLPTGITVAVTAGRGRGIGPIDRVIATVAVTGEQAERDGDVERGDPVGSINADGLVPRPG